MSAWLALAAVLMVETQVELRRGEPELPPGAVVTAVMQDGVTVSVPGDAGGKQPIVLGWQSIRAVQGPLEAEARPFAELADKAWRASSRLRRGDFVMAEPLLDELFPLVAGRSGPTAMMVCDGLLRCRLKRGARVGAIEAWLAGFAARGTGGGSGDTGLIDQATGLAPSLPPVWIGTAGLQVWAAASPRMESGAGPASLLEVLYRQAARFECGMPVTLPDAPTESPGARLVWEMVAARAGGPERRREAREALAARVVDKPGGWEEAWCRAGLGRSLLREDSVDSRRLGVVELLHVPARLAEQSPYLAGIALAEAAVEVKAEGADDAAWRLRSELMARYPDHPALQWEALRGWAAPARPAAEPKKPGPETKEVPDGDEPVEGAGGS